MEFQKDMGLWGTFYLILLGVVPTRYPMVIVGVAFFATKQLHKKGYVTIYGDKINN